MHRSANRLPIPATLLAILLAGCGDDLCERAASKVARCTGEMPTDLSQCDADLAQQVLEATCDELSGASGKADIGGLLCLFGLCQQRPVASAVKAEVDRFAQLPGPLADYALLVATSNPFADETMVLVIKGRAEKLQRRLEGIHLAWDEPWAAALVQGGDELKLWALRASRLDRYWIDHRGRSYKMAIEQENAKSPDLRIAVVDQGDLLLPPAADKGEGVLAHASLRVGSAIGFAWGDARYSLFLVDAMDSTDQGDEVAVFAIRDGLGQALEQHEMIELSPTDSTSLPGLNYHCTTPTAGRATVWVTAPADDAPAD